MNFSQSLMGLAALIALIGTTCNPATAQGQTAQPTRQPIVSSMPQYPPRAADRGLEGQCIVEFEIDYGGNVADPRIHECTPSGVFERTSLRAASRLRFVPLIVDGQPAETRNARYRYVFALDGGSASMLAADPDVLDQVYDWRALMSEVDAANASIEAVAIFSAAGKALGVADKTDQAVRDATLQLILKAREALVPVAEGMAADAKASPPALVSLRKTKESYLQIDTELIDPINEMEDQIASVSVAERRAVSRLLVPAKIELKARYEEFRDDPRVRAQFRAAAMKLEGSGDPSDITGAFAREHLLPDDLDADWVFEALRDAQSQIAYRMADVRDLSPPELRAGPTAREMFEMVFSRLEERNRIYRNLERVCQNPNDYQTEMMMFGSLCLQVLFTEDFTFPKFVIEKFEKRGCTATDVTGQFRCEYVARTSMDGGSLPLNVAGDPLEDLVSIATNSPITALFVDP